MTLPPRRGEASEQGNRQSKQGAETSTVRWHPAPQPAARSDWGRGQAPPYPLTPAPPPLPHHAPSSPPPPLSRLRLSRHLGERGQLVGGGEGDKGRGEPGGGEEEVGARNVQGPRQQRLARAACWGQAWTLGCGREFLPSSSHQPCRPGFGPGTAAACLPQGRTCPGAPKQDFRSLPSDLAGL